jgi:hypothetical protein
MRSTFTIRLYKDNDRSPVLTDIDSLTISNITILSKYGKFDPACFHKGNQQKFGYRITTSKPFFKTAGSHSGSLLAFKGEYVDITLHNFPRYPCFGQQKHSGPGWSGDPFPIWLNYRKIEFLMNNTKT